MRSITQIQHLMGYTSTSVVLFWSVLGNVGPPKARRPDQLSFVLSIKTEKGKETPRRGHQGILVGGPGANLAHSWFNDWAGVSEGRLKKAE